MSAAGGVCSGEKPEVIDLTTAVRSVGFQEAAEQLRAWGNALLPSPRPTTPQTSPQNVVREATFVKFPSELASPDGPVRNHKPHYHEDHLRYRHRRIGLQRGTKYFV